MPTTNGGGIIVIAVTYLLIISNYQKFSVFHILQVKIHNNSTTVLLKSNCIKDKESQLTNKDKITEFR